MHGWEVERLTGSAAALHARPLPVPPRRRVWLLEVDRPALVLGSAQPESDADTGALAAAGVELVRRRSGGGAVLLQPGRALWVDVIVPPGDSLWEHDVGRAFHWLGDVWVAALGDLGVVAAAHRGPLVRTPWSARACFAGLGPGEVTVGGRKVVGISQRRTRHGARFQCAVLRCWDPAALLALLALDDDERARGARALAEAAAGVPVDPVVLARAFLARLP